MRISSVASAFVICAAVGACSSSSDKAEVAQACPNAYRVQEAASLVRFKPGPGRDPIDVVFRAEIGSIQATCRFSRRRQHVDVDLVIQFLVAQGPTAGLNRVSFDYAVGVVGTDGAQLQRQRFTTEVVFDASRTRGALTDEVTVGLPFRSDFDPSAAYRIAVGLVLTPTELDYNRRAAGSVTDRR